MKDFNIFPLNSLVKQAKKFNSYKEFYTFYIVDIFHGYYWHITKDANFKISSQTGPRDMSSMSNGGITQKGAIMLTSHFELWDDYYNSHPETEERIIKRPFAVLFDASDVDPKMLKQVGRGFGNEVYLNNENAKKIKTSCHISY